MVEHLRQSIQARFQKQSPMIHLPEAWLYWPITAGGACLQQAIMIASIYSEAFAQRIQVPVPEVRTIHWQQRAEGWGLFYKALTRTLDESAPTPNKVMEALVHDFIQRGSTLSVGRQHQLSPYWRWILYIYGPQILDYLGTFRFLITDLVPLQLTNKNNRQLTTNASSTSLMDDDFYDLDEHPF